MVCLGDGSLSYYPIAKRLGISRKKKPKEESLNIILFNELTNKMVLIIHVLLSCDAIQLIIHANKMSALAD